MNFIFSNNLFFKDYITYIEDYSSKYQKAVTTIKDNIELETILLEHFQFFFIKFLENLRNNTPMIIIILMKIIYTSVKQTFTIDSKNYHPVYTFLVFNFLTSPKLQEIYQINYSHKDIMDLNRLLRVSL